MANIPGSVRLTGFIAPTDSTDVFPVTDPTWGLGGLRRVSGTTERNLISTGRRESGMLVYSEGDDNYYKLGTGLTNSDWTIFMTGSGSGDFLALSGGTVTGVTSFTSGISSNSFSGGTFYSGGTDLYNIFLTSADLPAATTAGNGITKAGNNITLGGALTGDTYIDNSGYLFRTNEFSATTISAQTIHVDILSGYSPITIADGIQSTLSSAGNSRSIAWGDNVTAGVSQDEIILTIVSGITIGLSSTWGVNAVLIPDLTGAVETEWLGYLTTPVSLSLYGGSDPLETYVVDVTFFEGSETSLFDVSGFSSPVGLTHTTMSATVLTQEYIDINSYGFGKDVDIAGDYSMAVGSGITSVTDFSYRFGQSIKSSVGFGNFTLVTGRDINTTSSLFSTVFGRNINTSSNYSHTGGGGNTVGNPLSNTGDYSFMHMFTDKNGKGIVLSDYTAILGGFNHKIDSGSDFSAIIGGDENIITSNVLRSIVLGGLNITGTTNDTVYVPNFNIDSTPLNDNNLTQILARDTDGTVKYVDSSVFSNSGATGGNFLALSGGTVTGDTIFTQAVSADTMDLTSTTVAQLTMAPVNAGAPADGSMWFTTSGGTTTLNYQVTGTTKSVELT
jgi:hypothetical protein